MEIEQAFGYLNRGIVNDRERWTASNTDVKFRPPVILEHKPGIKSAAGYPANRLHYWETAGQYEVEVVASVGEYYQLTRSGWNILLKHNLVGRYLTDTTPVFVPMTLYSGSGEQATISDGAIMTAGALQKAAQQIVKMIGHENVLGYMWPSQLYEFVNQVGIWNLSAFGLPRQHDGEYLPVGLGKHDRIGLTQIPAYEQNTELVPLPIVFKPAIHSSKEQLPPTPAQPKQEIPSALSASQLPAETKALPAAAKVKPAPAETSARVDLPTPEVKAKPKPKPAKKPVTNAAPAQVNPPVPEKTDPLVPRNLTETLDNHKEAIFTHLTSSAEIPKELMILLPEILAEFKLTNIKLGNLEYIPQNDDSAQIVIEVKQPRNLKINVVIKNDGKNPAGVFVKDAQFEGLNFWETQAANIMIGRLPGQLLEQLNKRLTKVRVNQLSINSSGLNFHCQQK